MVRSGFRNLCFWNRFVSEMLRAAYGLSKELRVECCVVLTQDGLSRLSSDYFQGQA